LSDISMPQAGGPAAFDHNQSFAGRVLNGSLSRNLLFAPSEVIWQQRALISEIGALQPIA